MKKLLYVLCIVYLFLPGAVKGFVFSAEEKLDIKTTIESSVDVILEKSGPEAQVQALEVYHKVNLLIAKDQDPKGTIVTALDFMTEVVQIPTGNIPFYLQKMIDEEETAMYHHLRASIKTFIENGSMVPDSLCEKMECFENLFTKQEYQKKKKELVRIFQTVKSPIQIDPTHVLIYLGGDNAMASPVGRSMEEMYDTTKIESTYKWRRHPILKKWRYHNGQDLDSKSGDPVFSAINGVVTLSSYDKEQCGYYVKVYNEETNMTFRSLHHLKNLVKKGQYVHAGEKIAQCGSTGLSKGAHVHSEIWYGDETLNPAPVYQAYQSDLQVLVVEHVPNGKQSKYIVDTDYDLQLDNLLAILPSLANQQNAMCQIAKTE